MQIKKNNREILEKCPWCGSKGSTAWGNALRGFYTVKCRCCSLVYVKNRLNKEGLMRYYSRYLPDVHRVDKELNAKRELMYKIEFDIINSYCGSGSVLDVGCSGGYFLKYFKQAGYDCYGTEISVIAREIAGKKYKIFPCDLLDVKTGEKFDLIVFRGVIEHIPFPRAYLDKAVSLTKKKGYVFITSVPNAASVCGRLFKEKWRQHAPEEHLVHFTAKHFDLYFKNAGFEKITERMLYEETPYADVENDILKVAKAIQLKKKNKPITFASPAFWGSLMTLIYRKR